MGLQPEVHSSEKAAVPVSSRPGASQDLAVPVSGATGIGLSARVPPTMLGYVGRTAGNRAVSRLVSHQRHPGGASTASGAVGVLVDRDANHTPDPRESNQDQEDARLVKVWADQKKKVDGTDERMTEVADRQNLLRSLIGQQPLWAANREAGVLVDEVDKLIGLRGEIDTVLNAAPDGEKETRLVQDVGIFETNLISASVWAESYDEEIDYYNSTTLEDHLSKIADAEFVVTEAEAVRAKASADLASVNVVLRTVEADIRAIDQQLRDLHIKRVDRGALSALSVVFGVAAILVPGPWSVVLGALSLGCGLAAAHVNGDFSSTDRLTTAAGVTGTTAAAAKAVPKVAKLAAGAGATVGKLAGGISNALGAVGAVITAIAEIDAQIADADNATGLRARLGAARQRALAVQPKYDSAVVAAAAAAAKVDRAQAQVDTVIQERAAIARPTR